MEKERQRKSKLTYFMVALTVTMAIMIFAYYEGKELGEVAYHYLAY